MSTVHSKPKELVDEIEEVVKELEQTRSVGSDLLTKAKAAAQKAEEQTQRSLDNRDAQARALPN